MDKQYLTDVVSKAIEQAVLEKYGSYEALARAFSTSSKTIRELRRGDWTAVDHLLITVLTEFAPQDTVGALPEYA
jgi:hypothetical protein